eukprot:338314-Hanusia_phi.AAC.1
MTVRVTESLTRCKFSRAWRPLICSVVILEAWARLAGSVVPYGQPGPSESESSGGLTVGLRRASGRGPSQFRPPRGGPRPRA